MNYFLYYLTLATALLWVVTFLLFLYDKATK